MGKPRQGRGEQRGGVESVTVDEERSMWGSTGSEWEDAMDSKAKGRVCWVARAREVEYVVEMRRGP